MTQIAEQNDRRLVARDMGPRRDDQRPDDHLFDVAEYFLGGLLDMLGVERLRLASDGLAPVVWLKQRFSGVSMAGVFNTGSFNRLAPRSSSKKPDHPIFPKRCDATGLPCNT